MKKVCLFVVCVASGNLRLRTYLHHAEMRVGRGCRCAPCAHVWAECTNVCIYVFLKHDIQVSLCGGICLLLVVESFGVLIDYSLEVLRSAFA